MNGTNKDSRSSPAELKSQSQAKTDRPAP